MEKKKTFDKNNRGFLFNLLIVVIMTVLTFVFLFASGIVRTSSPDFNKAKSALSEYMTEQKMSEGGARDLKRNYGIDSRNLSDFTYYPPATAMDASEVLIIKLSKTSDREDILNRISERKIKQIDTFKSYKPEEAAIMEKSTVIESGDIIIFISSVNAQKIRSLFDGII